MNNDELIIYRGQDYKINDNIIIHQPTLDEICSYGEKEYYQMIYAFTSVGADLKWQLSDMGIDYTKIDDFELFREKLIKNYSQEKTSILFGDLDFEKLKRTKNNENNEICIALLDEDSGEPIVVIDEYTYYLIANHLRKMHGLKKNEQVPANESTRKILIDDDREEYERNKDKEYTSPLLNLISTMINIEGFKYNHNEVWSMKINAFMDSVRRISKIKNAEALLHGSYSQGIDLKKIDKKQLDWLGELD